MTPALMRSLGVAVACAVLWVTGCGTQSPAPPSDGGGQPPGPVVIDDLSATGRLSGFIYRRPDGSLVNRAMPSSDADLVPLGDAGVAADVGAVAFTNGGGAFAFPALPVGTRALAVDPQGLFADPPRSLGTVTIEAGRTSSGARGPADADTGPGAAMGWACDVPGVGPVLASAPPSAARALGNQSLLFGTTQVTTDDTGFYLVGGLAPGQLSVSLPDGRGTGKVTVLGGLTALGSDSPPAQWGAATGYTGFAFDAPEPYFFVEPTKQTVRAVSRAIVTLDSGQAALSGSDGRYVLYGVSPGLHTLAATSRGVGGMAAKIIVLANLVTAGAEAPAGSISRIALATPDGGDSLAPGQSVQVAARAFGPDGKEWEGFSHFAWSVSDIQRARVDRTGLVTAVATGDVSVIAEAGGVSSALLMEVRTGGSNQPRSIDISWVGPNVLVAGEDRGLVVNVRDGDGGVIPGSPFEVISSDSSVVAVTSGTSVHANAPGNATLIARALGVPNVIGWLDVEVIARRDRLVVAPLALAFAASGVQYVRLEDRIHGWGGLINWTAQPSASWLSVGPGSGHGDSDLAVAVDATSLQTGTYTGTVTVDAGPDGLRTVAVTVSIQDVIIIIE